MTIIVAAYLDTRLSREFWRKTALDENTDCWVWVDRVSLTKTAMHGAKVAWRFAYERLVRAILKGSKCRRVCENALCVNPAHRVVELPLNCPTCGHKLEQPEGRAKVFAMADGSVAVDPDDRDTSEPEIRKFTLADIAGASKNLSAPPFDPHNDPNHVDYVDDEPRLTLRFKWSKSGKPREKFELTNGRWVYESQLTKAQYSHMMLAEEWMDNNTPNPWVLVGLTKEQAQKVYFKRT